MGEQRTARPEPAPEAEPTIPSESLAFAPVGFKVPVAWDAWVQSTPKRGQPMALDIPGGILTM